MLSSSIKAVLCDIGGVLYVGDVPIEGAIEAVRHLKQHYPIRFLTNTTQKTSAQVVDKLQELGFKIDANEVLTALDVTKMFLQSKKSTAKFLLTDDALAFFEDMKEYPQKYVVVGDAQDNFSYANLNAAFRVLNSGAELVAIAKNKYFKDADNELSMDAGCFVSALEYASSKESLLIGKPSKAFYHMACADMDVKPSACVMIGDDIEGDIQGAQKAGLNAILVQTGKFALKDLELGITPQKVIASIADL